MKILVTGGAGFIGTVLCEKLLERKHEVLCLDRVRSPISHRRNLKSLIMDITNPKIFDPSYGALGWWKDVDFCFHLAAMADVDEVRIHRDEAFDVNVRGTFNIIEVCRRMRIPLAFASTACVYGHTTKHPSTEDGPTFPVDWYGVTKRAGEELVKGLMDSWIILRYGTTFGTGMRPALCTHIFLTQARNKKPFTIKGTGKQTRNFIYVDDLVEGNIRAMEYHLGKFNRKLMGVHGKNQIFNLTGEKTRSINELADVCANVVYGSHQNCDSSKPYKVEYLPDRPDDVPYEDISIKKAEALLGWSPKIDLERGMRLINDEWNKKAESVQRKKG